MHDSIKPAPGLVACTFAVVCVNVSLIAVPVFPPFELTIIFNFTFLRFLNPRRNCLLLLEFEMPHFTFSVKLEGIREDWLRLSIIFVADKCRIVWCGWDPMVWAQQHYDRPIFAPCRSALIEIIKESKPLKSRNSHSEVPK